MGGSEAKRDCEAEARSPEDVAAVARRNATAVSAQWPGRAGGADAGLRAHLLRQEAGAVDLRARAAVEDREQPDADEADGHREQRRRGVGEQRRALRVAERGFPHRRRHDGQHHRRDQPEEAADHRALVVQSFHSTRHEQHREVGRRGDREGQATMKAMFCFSKAMPSTTATMPSTTVVILRDAQFRGAVGLALLDHRGVEVVRHRRGARQRQARDHRQDGGEGHRRDEAEEDVAADRVGQVDGRHVAAAEQARPWRRGTAGWSARR